MPVRLDPLLSAFIGGSKALFHFTAHLYRLRRLVAVDVVPAQRGAGGDAALQLHLVREADGQRALRSRIGGAHELAPHRVAALALGYSWGGFESLIVPANLRGARSVRPWDGGPLVRLQIGLEDPEDLFADLVKGLDRMQSS